MEEFLKQIVCPHEHKRGGNDFTECTDCGLSWDYRKRDGYNQALVERAQQLLKTFDNPKLETSGDWNWALKQMRQGKITWRMSTVGGRIFFKLTPLAQNLVCKLENFDSWGSASFELEESQGPKTYYLAEEQQ